MCNIINLRLGKNVKYIYFYSKIELVVFYESLVYLGFFYVGYLRYNLLFIIVVSSCL